MVGGAYTGYSKKEAEWDSFLGVVRVTRRLENIVMFVSGFCVQICVDSVVAEACLYINNNNNNNNNFIYIALKSNNCPKRFHSGRVVTDAKKLSIHG